MFGSLSLARPDMSFFAKTILIYVPIERVWSALTSPTLISAWMGGEVQSDLYPGGRYVFFNGQTSGHYTLIEAPYRLEYTWRLSSWPTVWIDSSVRWRLRRLPDGTDLQLVHDNFPDPHERQRQALNWDLQWLKPMKTWLEQGDLV